MSDDVFWRYLPQTRRPKYTVVEYIIFVAFVAIAVRVAMPFTLEYLNDRKAQEVLTAVFELESAARRAAEAGDFAALEDAPAGQAPVGIDNYLSGEFAFDRGDYTLDWDLFDVKGEMRELMVGGVHGAISVQFDDRALLAAVVRAAGRRIWLQMGDQVSILVPNLTGESSG